MSGNRASNSVFAAFRSFVKRKLNMAYKFDLQYARQQWNGLRDTPELARYSVIIGYIYHFFQKPVVADLGCGEGVLAEKMKHTDFAVLLGVDFSEVAIEKARQIPDSRCRFEVGDLNTYVPLGKYDAVIFNESIYYLKNPAQALTRLCSNLNNGGIFIFSIVDKGGLQDNDMWQEICTNLQPIDTTRVTNKAGDSWTIGVFQPKN